VADARRRLYALLAEEPADTDTGTTDAPDPTPNQ